MIQQIFAHAEVAHESGGESFVHYLETWWIAIIFFFVASYIIATATYSLSKKSLGRTVAVLMVVYLITALTTYEISPVLSILSTLFGFCIAIGLTFFGLMMPPAKGKK